MAFDKAYHDFGRVKKGEAVEYTYKFTNKGSEDIILELVSGCECSEITYDEGATYKPGERGEIKVIFHSDDETPGKVEKIIDILLENINPKTGYQYIYDVKYGAIVYE